MTVLRDIGLAIVVLVLALVSRVYVLITLLVVGTLLYCLIAGIVLTALDYL